MFCKLIYAPRGSGYSVDATWAYNLAQSTCLAFLTSLSHSIALRSSQEILGQCYLNSGFCGKLWVFFLKICMYECSICMYVYMSEEDVRSHYRWLWATMWFLGIELRTSGRAVSPQLPVWVLLPVGFRKALNWNAIGTNTAGITARQCLVPGEF